MSKNSTLILPYTIPAEIASHRFAARSFIDSKNTFFLSKRFLDVSISLIFLVFLLSWMTPLLAILILLDSRGPVFFLQKRVGRGGKTFVCIKFRTMHVNRECHSRTSVKNDHRITRLGRFLRRTNIDEFPQFLNVLKGEMSVIGPRPHMHADCSRFSQVVFGYKFRNLVKPGITGLAQVKGYHGPAITYESIFRRFQWDAFYVRNASFWLDLRILKQTILQRI